MTFICNKRKFMICIRIITGFIALISLISCSASYKELMNSNFEPEHEISKYLLLAYKDKAEFEAKVMHDWDSAKLYSEKALKAARGEKIFPQHISYWKIQSEELLGNQYENRLGIIKAYNNLMIVYDNALLLDPFNLAKAISSLDCWSEQKEENWQIWDINKCRDDYLNAMNHLYNAMAENQKEDIQKIDSVLNNNSDNVAVVTQDHNENNLQIIYFDFNKSILSNVNIDKIYDFIKNNKDNIKNYIIVGHTDTKGAKKYNQTLSNKRAIAVKSILIELGINSENIKVLGRGETNLRVKTEDNVAHPANRRAEISLLK